MNIGSACPWIVAGWLFSGILSVSAVESLPDSSFVDWSGLVRESDLADGSVLFEYTARTYSGRTSGAMLAISFVPRFNCEPTINVRLPRTDNPVIANPRLEFVFNGEEQSFAGFVDSDAVDAIYSVAASTPEVLALRNAIEVSSRTNIRVFQELDSSSDKASGPYNLTFSLLGSRLATSMAEKHCWSHTPLAYDPKG